MMASHTSVKKWFMLDHPTLKVNCRDTNPSPVVRCLNVIANFRPGLRGSQKMVCSLLRSGVNRHSISVKISGGDFTKGLKSRFRLKFKTLVLNIVKRMLSLWF